jgi:hypothetical protein
MSAPTRFPSGISTQAVNSTLGMYPAPDPTELCEDFDEFVQYVAADWTVTNTTSHQAIALVAGAGGLISSVGGASSVTSDIGAIIAAPLDFNLQANAVSATYPPTAQAWFYCAFKATTALNDQLQIGVTAANAALTPTDGIYFNKAAGSAAITLVVRKGSASLAATAYSSGTTTVATLVDATFIKLGWYYTGKGTIDVFVNDAKVCSVDVTTAAGLVAATFPQATAMGHGFGCKAAATAPTTADIIVDFMMTSQTRPY